MPYGFVRIFLFFFLFFFFLFFILPPSRFPDDNFWPPRQTVPEFLPVTGHGHRKRCIPTPRGPRRGGGGAWGAPNTPKSPLQKKKFVGKKKLYIFRPPPPPVLGPQKHFVCEFFFSEYKIPPPPPSPPPPNNTHLNPRAILNNPTITAVRDSSNTSNKYAVFTMSLYTWSSLSINVHTISNPRTQCL